MTKQVIIYFILIAALCYCSNCLCDNSHSDETTARLCSELTHIFEQALLTEKNLFRMQNAFFYSPTANPVLLKVVYNITYSDNLASANSMVNEIMHSAPPLCDPDNNDSTISLNNTEVILGWTSSGIYTLFHPGVLNFMQLQLPYILLKWIQYDSRQTTNGPEADSFLWDGSYELPTLHLDLHVTYLMCIPFQDLFDSAMEKLTTQMKLYTAQKSFVSFDSSVADIGFALPSAMVLAGGISLGRDFLLVNLYTLIANIVYASFVLVFWHRYKHTICKNLHDRSDIKCSISRKQSQKQNKDQSQKTVLEKYFSGNYNLIVGATIVATVLVIFELCVRIVRCITWSVYANDSTINFVIFWLPQLFFGVLAIGPNLMLHTYYSINAYKMVKGDGLTPLCLRVVRHDKGYILHSILVLCLFLYLIIYSAFPTFILTFAYPTKVASIVTYVLAFIFSLTVMVALLSYIHEHMAPTKEGNFKQRRNYTAKFILASVCVLLPIVAYFYGLLYVLLYVLVIGRASVVSTGPLAVLSLLPSFILSGIAWIGRKSLVLPEDENSKADNSEADESSKADKKSKADKIPRSNL